MAGAVGWTRVRERRMGGEEEGVRKGEHERVEDDEALGMEGERAGDRKSVV